MTSRRAVPLVGTVGVPARYGGFETLAEQLCRNIRPDDAELIIYCERSAYAPDERSSEFQGHKRIFIPLRANGIASMLYDAWALIHASFRCNAKDVFVFGYSGAWILPLLRLLCPKVRYIVNVDGMEWRRDKFSISSKILLKLLEYFSARCASVIIADNDALAELFRNRYGREPVTIAYGGDHTLATFLQEPQSVGHYLAIARIEPENNTETIIRGCIDANVPLTFIGNWNSNDYGRSLRDRYVNYPHIKLLDPIYNQGELAPWRSGAIGYIHGHSVGGTNPSLVEALFHTNILLNFECSFNRATLSNCGHYFNDVASLANLLRSDLAVVSESDLRELRERYQWRSIAKQYFKLLTE